MATETVEVVQLKCERCGHRWFPNDPSKLPGTCANPDCRSPAWQRPKSTRVPPTHCPKDHPYDEENTYMVGNKRKCKKCKSEYDRQRRLTYSSEVTP